jgi:hypothetical protein
LNDLSKKKAFNAGVIDAQWLNDSDLIVSTENGEIVVVTFDGTTFQDKFKKQAHDGFVTCLATQHNSSFAISGSDDKT